MKCWLKFFYCACLALLLLLVAPAALAMQTIRSDFFLPSGQTSLEYESPVYQTKASYSGVITEWQTVGDTQENHDHTPQLFIRTQTVKGGWSEWLGIEADIDFVANKETKFDELINVAESTAYQYRVVVSEPNTGLKNLKFSFINAKGEKESLVSRLKSFVAGNEISGFIPVITRDQWGADESLNYLDTGVSADTSSSATQDSTGDGRSSGGTSTADPDIERIENQADGHNLAWPLQYAQQIRFIVVHHTVSSAGADPKQALRNIQYFHAVKRGWGDIGYNYIVDPQGRIYEGRRGGEKVIGGHSIPVNKTSIGISVMGNYQVDRPPKAVLEALSIIIQAKAELYQLDPLATAEYKGKTYPVVGGHRDSDATACPGQFLYNTLPAIRQLVALNMNHPVDNGEIIDTEPLREIVDLQPQETKSITIRLRNNSQTAWPTKDTYLADFDLEKTRQTLTFSGSSINDYKVGILQGTQPIAPGQVGEFKVSMVGGVKGGFASLNLTPVIDRKIKKENLIFVPVYVKKATFTYSLSPEKVTLDLDPGEAQTVKVTLKNTGNFTWNKDNETSVKIGVDKPKQDIDSLFVVTKTGTGRVLDLSSMGQVESGDQIKFELQIKAPSTRMHYTEELSPVIDGFGWGIGPNLKLEIANKIADQPTFEGQSTTNSLTDFGSVMERISTIKLLNTTTEIAEPTGRDAQQVRVNLSYFNLSATSFTVNSNYKLLVDGKVKKYIRSGDQVQIEKSETNIKTTVNGNTYLGRIARFEPFKPTLGIFTLGSYEARPAWNPALNDNSFRGTAEFRIDEDNLKVINELPLGFYLRGIAEVSNQSDPEVIKTLLILARTYAVYYLAPEHTKFAGKPYDLDDSPDRTQKYLGYGFETRSPNVAAHGQAVNNKVVTYNGQVVITPYFSRSDGRTKSAKEVWNWDHTPYLQSVEDKYCSGAGPGTQAGHGVGLSGCGAAGMATAGFNYEEIIKYFYQGVEIGS